MAEYDIRMVDGQHLTVTVADRLTFTPPVRTLKEAEAAIALDPEEPASLPEDPPSTRASLWWTLAGIAAAVVLALARRSATMPPPAPPPAPPTIWPYDGWRI